MITVRRKRRQRAPAVKPSPDLAKETLNGSTEAPPPALTDGQMVTVLAHQLQQARLCHYRILQCFGAKRVEHGELDWGGATQFINSLGAAFEQAVEAAGRQLSTELIAKGQAELIAKGQQEGHS